MSNDHVTFNEVNLNWDSALPYRKNSVISAIDIRVSDGGEHIVTLNSEGAIEREGTTECGDRVITDKRGQPYIVRSSKFESLYEPDPANPHQWRSRNYGIAFQAQSAMSILRNDGAVVTAARGDYIFRSFLTGTVNVIAPKDFESYKLDAEPQRTSGLGGLLHRVKAVVRRYAAG